MYFLKIILILNFVVGNLCGNLNNCKSYYKVGKKKRNYL